MIISRIEIRHVRLELAHPFETSFGRWTERHPVVVTVHSDIGATHAEAPCLIGPFYNEETTQTTLHVIRDFLAPRLLQQELTSIVDVHKRMAIVRGNYIAKSAFDTACYHLFSTEKNQSLSQYLCGTRDFIESGISIGIQTDIDRLVEVVDRSIREGYARIKIKIKPGWDLEPVRILRKHFPDVPLMVDANSAYTLNDLRLFKELDEFSLLMIEQPLGYDDLYEHSVLQSHIRTPVCLDESIRTVADARAALALKACRAINIKLARVGGLLPAVAIHDLCQAQEIPVWCGGMVESAIGQADCLALASLPNFRFPADIAPSERYFVRDLITPFVQLREGKIEVPTGPGLGFEIDEEFLEYATLERFTVD